MNTIAQFLRSLDFTGLDDVLTLFFFWLSIVVLLLYFIRSIVKRNVRHIVVTLSIAIILAGGYGISTYLWNPVDPLLITTDKQEYVEGEKVHITIKNRSFRSVYFNWCNHYSEIYHATSNKRAERFLDPCGPAYSELKPREKIEIKWTAGSYYSLPDEFEYRISYKLNESEETAPREAKSRRFRILDASSQE